MTTKPYAGTAVSTAKSQEDLRDTLMRFGADQFSFGEGTDWVGVELVHDDTLVRLRCPVRVPTQEEARQAALAAHRSSTGKAVTDPTERAKAERARVWRVLVWSVKARLVAVDEGLETFEQAFLSHLVDPATGRTIWQAVRGEIEAGVMQVGSQGLRELGTGRG